MGRKKTPASDAMATKERILKTAERIFREVGYAKTTVADIAGILGMSSSNIYRYFPTKAHINEEICDRLVRDIESRCTSTMDHKGTCLEQIKSFIVAYHRLIKENLLRENKLYDMISIAMEQHWPVIQGHSERIRSILRSLLDQGANAGEFKEIDRDRAARAVHEAVAVFIYPPLLERWVNEFADAAREDRVEKQLVFLLDLIFQGVCLR
ncbi:TetR family transcriptional regulator [Desulfovibrio aminophilus]|uniref:TetR/AcrR family transcriptional regulator n=1 Tax=Desulfovibrio aminophilus TaxID=81425 RepID=UPI003399BB8B